MVEPVAKPKPRPRKKKQPEVDCTKLDAVPAEDLEGLIIKRTQAMRDSTEQNNKDNIQALMAQAILIFLPYMYNGFQEKETYKGYTRDATTTIVSY